MGLYRRGKTWWYTYTYEGVRYQGSLKTENKKLAEKVYHKIISEIIEGKYYKNRAKQISFKKLVKEYLDTHGKWRDPYTVKHLLPVFGDLTLDQIKPNMIAEYKKRRLKEVKPATVYQELSLMRRMFNVARKEWEWVDENPVSKISFASLIKGNARDRWLTIEEEHKLLKHASPEWVKQIIAFALDTGMRRSEILNLRWKDVDLTKGFIRVEKSKNGEKRSIPCTQRVLAILKKMTEKKVVDISGRVFPVTINTLRSAFERAVEKAKIENFHFHDLRHTFATRLVQNGVDLYVVQKLLGHKSISMTMRYSHHSPESLKPSIQVLDSCYKSATLEAENN